MFHLPSGITTVEQYLQLARQEIERLAALEDTALPETRRLEVVSAVTDACETLWRFTDFAFQASDPEAVGMRQRIGGRDLQDFQQRVRAACPALSVCWETVNRSKPFEKTSQTKLEALAASASALIASVLSKVLRKPGRKRWRQKLVLADGQRLQATVVFRAALTECDRLRNR